MTTEIDWNGLPDRLKLLCDQVGGQTAFAGLVQMDRHTIWEFVKRRRSPPVPTLQTIAALYPCSLSWLLSGNGEAPPHDLSRFLAARKAKMVRAGSVKHRQTREALSEADTEMRVGGPVASAKFDEPSPDLDIYDRFPAVKAIYMVLGRIQENSKERPEIADRVFGPGLAAEIKAGRACPSWVLIQAFAFELGLDRASLVDE